MHILAFPGYAPGTIAVNTWMERGFISIAACMHLSSTVYEILVGNCNFFYPLAFNASVGGVYPIGIPGKSLVPIKLESWGYQEVKTLDSLAID